MNQRMEKSFPRNSPFAKGVGANSWKLTALAAASLLVTACSSAAPDATSPVLNGQYEASDVADADANGTAPSGPYITMTFAAATSEYAVWKTLCPPGGDNPCFEAGTFAWNGAHDTLTLTSDYGTVTSLPASALPPNPQDSPDALESERLRSRSTHGVVGVSYRRRAQSRAEWPVA